MSGAIETSFESLKLIVENMPLALSWASLKDGKILYMNPAFTELFGYELGDFSTVPEWFSTYVAPDQKDASLDHWSGSIESHDQDETRVDHGEISVRCKNDSVKIVRHETVRLPKAGLILATFVDTADGKRLDVLVEEAQRQAREKQILYGLFFAGSQEMIVVSPGKGGKTVVSPGSAYVTGSTPEEYLADNPVLRIHADDRAAYLAIIDQVRLGGPAQQIQFRMLHADGSYRWTEAHVHASVEPQTGEILGYVVSMRNISVQKENEEALLAENRRLAQLAGIDELTGIANRRLFQHALAIEAGRQSRKSTAVSLLLLDVDDFKGYNDLYGHLEGDSALRRVAERLQSLLHRPADLVARFGGEEFVLLLPMTDLQGAEKIARDILAAMAALGLPYPKSPTGLITVSIGVATWPQSQPFRQAELLKLADQALYTAKGAGRNTYRVAPSELA